MADHDPNDDTVLRQPAACEAPLSFTAWSPITVSDKTVTQKQAAPISAQEIAEMRRVHGASNGGWVEEGLIVRSTEFGPEVASFIGGSQARSSANIRFAVLAHERFSAILDAIEALTAKNQSLTDALNTTVHEATAAIDDRLKPEIERLTAENARLTSEANINGQRASYWRQKYAKLGNEVATENGLADRVWYDTHRAKVEAAAVAAKIAKRQAECRNCRDGFPAYVNPADWDTCPDCGKKFGAAAKEASIRNPLAHPGYPALVDLARESMRDGD